MYRITRGDTGEQMRGAMIPGNIPVGTGECIEPDNIYIET